MNAEAFLALCRAVVAAEAAVVVTLSALIVASAVISRWHAARLERQLTRGRAGLVRALTSDTDVLDVAPLEKLNRSVQAALVLEFGATLVGRERSRLTGIGLAIGIAQYAERCCRSRFWWRRLWGARLVTALDHDCEAMRVLLRDPSSRVRVQALVWAAGRVDQDIVEELVRHLGDPERLCRFTVQDSLLRLGRPAAVAVARFLGESEGPGLEDGLSVARGLAQPELLDPALRLASHPSDAIRARAVAVLGVLGGDVAARVVVERLGDPSYVVRVAAARATGHLGYWRASGEVACLLRDRSWPVRRESALALRRIGGLGLLTLRRALRDENPFAADMARQVLDLPDPVYLRVAG